MSTHLIEHESKVPFVFNPENREKITNILKRYPKDRTISALLPLLDLAQRQNGGWLSRSALEAVASLLSLPPMRVYEVASFYSMFNFRPVGQYFIQLCKTTPCWLRGSDNLLSVCHKYLKIQDGETTPDKQFSLKEVECLGACANAPMVQINDDYYEDLDEESFQALLIRLQNGERVSPGSAQGRKASSPKTLSLQGVKK